MSRKYTHPLPQDDKGLLDLHYLYRGMVIHKWPLDERVEMKVWRGVKAENAWLALQLKSWVREALGK